MLSSYRIEQTLADMPEVRSSKELLSQTRFSVKLTLFGPIIASPFSNQHFNLLSNLLQNEVESSEKNWNGCQIERAHQGLRASNARCPILSSGHSCLNLRKSSVCRWSKDKKRSVKMNADKDMYSTELLPHRRCRLLLFERQQRLLQNTGQL